MLSCLVDRGYHRHESETESESLETTHHLLPPPFFRVWITAWVPAISRPNVFHISPAPTPPQQCYVPTWLPVSLVSFCSFQHSPVLLAERNDTLHVFILIWIFRNVDKYVPPYKSHTQDNHHISWSYNITSYIFLCERIILKWIWRREIVRIWTGLMWPG